MKTQQDVPVSPARPHRRWIARSIAGLLVVGLAAHAATWFYITSRIIAGIPIAFAQAAQNGWVIQAGAPTRAGWPGAAIVRVPNVTSTRALGGTVLRATFDHLDLGLFPTDPIHLRIAPAGPATFQLGQAAPIDVTANQASLRVPLDGVGPGTLTITNLVIGHDTLAIGQIDARIEQPTRAATAELITLAGTAELITLAGTAGPITTSPPLPAPFDGGAQLTMRLLVTPPLPPARTPAQSAALWQAANGRVTMPEFRLDWGPLRAVGSLSGGLDPHLQPVGQARLQVNGALDVLETASRAGLVPPGPASAARAVLTLLTLAAHGGPIILPITLRDQTLTAAQFALVKLPMLDWSP